MKRIPLLFLFALLLTGCPDRREEKPSPGSMPDEEVELSEAAFDELEGWQKTKWRKWRIFLPPTAAK